MSPLDQAFRLGVGGLADDHLHPQGREVRHTIIRVITAHLREGAALSWEGAHAGGGTVQGGRPQSVWGPDGKRADSQAAPRDGYHRAGLEAVCDRWKVRR